MTRYLVDKSHERDTAGEEELIFEEFLRDRGLKFTKARRQLLRRVFEMHDHFTADQLLDRLKAQKVRASKATVYRTLTVLLECQLLTAHDFGEGARYYEHTFGHDHHDHLFCLHCKKILEFRNDRIESLQDEVAASLGFQTLSHSLKIFGLCGECAARSDVVERYQRAPAVLRNRS